jgi:hypothetical protein
MFGCFIALAGLPIVGKRISDPEWKDLVRQFAWVLFILGLIAFAIILVETPPQAVPIE